MADRIRRAARGAGRRALSPLLARVDAALDRALAPRLDRMAAQLAGLRDIATADLDRLPELRSALAALRQTEEYARTLAEAEPLVTVRIATYNRARILTDRCLPSVLAQTYERLEVIVVGDGCSDDTAECIRRLGDPRLRFVNLPSRSVYPPEPQRRWLVAGSLPMNVGARLARGSWLAPNDDDDEFTPDHVERLLGAALGRGLELAYGRYWVPPRDGHEALSFGAYPPRHGEFGFQAAIHMTALRFFEYETGSWVLGEPSDWNLCRRMLAAGVQMGFVDSVVCRVHPSGPRAIGE